MVDVHEVLRPLVDDPSAKPPPVEEIAARARRRRGRRRSAALVVVSVALVAVVRLAPSLDSSRELTEVDPSTRGGDSGAATTTTSPAPDTSAESPSTESTFPSTTAPSTTTAPQTETTEPAAPDGSGSPGPVGPHDPFGRLEAEHHDAQRGVAVTALAGGGGGVTVGDGDHVAFHDVDFGTGLATQVEARVASAAGPGAEGLIEVRLHDVASPPFATIHVGGTGGREAFTTAATQTPAIGGKADVYVTFTSSQPGDFAVIDWFRFVP